jgi:hypothetical protein
MNKITFNGLEHVNDFDEAHKLLKFEPHSKHVMKNSFYNGDYAVFKNDDYVFGIRSIKTGAYAGNHVQGYRGNNLLDFADFVINLTKKQGLPYVWFGTRNKALVDEVASKYNVIEHDQAANGDTIYKVAV